MKRVVIAAVISMALPVAAHAASAVIKSADGQEMGTLNLRQTGDGVHITGTIEGLEPGDHAFHIHAVGKCEPPFQSAGGHFNPFNVPHGKISEGGPHSGDMNNVTVPDSSPVEIDVINSGVTLNPNGKASLFDADGSAIVFHAGPDDYQSQPSGAAGGRVGCGVIQ